MYVVMDYDGCFYVYVGSRGGEFGGFFWGVLLRYFVFDGNDFVGGYVVGGGEFL